MRRKEKAITDSKEIEKILQESNVCRLAMVDGDKPYMVPMNFGYRDACLFFHSAKEGRKIDLIKKNPNVCFEVDQLIRLKKAKLACDWGVEYKSVIGSGKAQLLEDSNEKKKALNIIMSQYSDRTFEYPDDTLEKTLVIKVVIDEMTGKQS
ncbi:pyridoxamine 5'-phosphate oxidase family protein [Desulfobacula sp.]|uniref:pyridoxamine 5'-phosphate oxidase family protein n=1 Tax=Desulfobacula sp. TaxID=2593537 RepID=UPI00262204DC|nr:pyridoxamine 5'-phosphate oxidase family protein [Desulfobacula sp.]